MLNNSTSPAILPMQCYMPCLSHGSLFSGIGGFDLAAHWLGWQNIFQCEKDEWCRKVLAKNFPNTNRYEDIKEFNAKKYHGAIDVISGGFPCQPFSVAGKQRGKEDDRYLWGEMLRVIGEVEPTFVVGENVTGIIGMALDTVLSDLEAQGYTTETFIIPACAKNAWHRRDRVWITAYKNTNRFRCDSSNRQKKSDFGKFGEFGTRDNEWLHRKAIYADTESGGWDSEAQQKLDEKTNGGKQGRGFNHLCKDGSQKAEIGNGFFQDTNSSRLEEHKLLNTSLLERPSGSGEAIEERWAVEPELGRVANGIPDRVDRLKGLGNAIVPQVAYEIFSAIGTVARHGI